MIDMPFVQINVMQMNGVSTVTGGISRSLSRELIFST
jgi:hypothetical protein